MCYRRRNRWLPYYTIPYHTIPHHGVCYRRRNSIRCTFSSSFTVPIALLASFSPLLLIVDVSFIFTYLLRLFPGNRPPDIPSKPETVYTNEGWQGYAHWLGTKPTTKLAKPATKAVAKQNQQFLLFKKALVFARSLKLNSQLEWNQWRTSDARPANIPSNPDKTYKRNGWQGYHHWLGIGIPPAVRNPMFMPFTKALLYARSLNLKGHKEWQGWSKSGSRPANMPSDPGKIYKHEGWEGWGHWLDSANSHTKVFMPFKEALLFARSLRLKTQKEWMAWCKSGARPPNLPTAPDRTYRHDGWRGLEYWLGTNSYRQESKQRRGVVARQQHTAAGGKRSQRLNKDETSPHP